jgi:hypothetical protein
MAQESKQDRDERIRAASLKGEPVAAIAEAEGVSVATVRRSLKASTDATLDRAEAAGKAARAEKAADRKAERKLAAVPDAGSAEAPKPKPRKDGGSAKLAEVLAINGKWTDDDRALIEREVERIGAASFAIPASGGYARVLDKQGEVLAWVEKSRLCFAARVAPEGSIEKADGTRYVALSTARKSA